jgi:hypothetical protein
VRATCTVTMDDFAWGDQVGDFYLASRSALPQRMFWASFLARVKTFSNCTLVIYDGYEGDALAAMRQRLYVLDGIDGPAKGKVTLRGVDPLMLADSTHAMFPPAMNMSLVQDLAIDDTKIRVTTDDEWNLLEYFGMTTERYVVIGSELIQFSDYNGIDPGVYDLVGLTRGMRGSTVAEAKVGDMVQRAGHFDTQSPAGIAKWLLNNATPIDPALVDDAGWVAEAEGWLDMFNVSAWVTQPTPVEDLVGELCQQGPFFVWWDEFAQLIRLQAIRAPQVTPELLTDTDVILADSATLTRMPQAQLTRVFIYYRAFNVMASGQDNWRYLYGLVNGDAELPEAGGLTLQVDIFARWLGSSTHAAVVADHVALIYGDIPRVLTFDVSAKDRELTVGQVIDVQSRVSVDSEGRALTERWLITAAQERVPGQVYSIQAQAYPLVGRFARMMADTAPDYAAASDTEKATGFFMCDDDGLMADGSQGYLMQ